MSTTTDYRSGSVFTMDHTFKVEEIAHLFDLEPEEVVAVREFYRATQTYDEDFCKAPPMRAARRRTKRLYNRRRHAMVKLVTNQRAKIRWFVNVEKPERKIKVSHHTFDQLKKQKAVNTAWQRFDHYVAQRFWGAPLKVAEG